MTDPEHTDEHPTAQRPRRPGRPGDDPTNMHIDAEPPGRTRPANMHIDSEPVDER